LNVAQELDEMKRTPTLLTVVALMACCAPLFSAAAQTVSHTSVKPERAWSQRPDAA
jgi:hypothetical protein